MLYRSSSIIIGLFSILFVLSSFAKPVRGNKAIRENFLLLEDTFHVLRTIKVNNNYSLDIQKHLHPMDSLNADASLQYGDESEDLYIIVIDESKADFIKTCKKAGSFKSRYSTVKNYRKMELQMMQTNGANFQGKPTIKAEKINNLHCEIVDFVAKVSGIDEPIYYETGFFEGTDKMYLVLTWTLLGQRKLYETEMNSMLHSFRLVN